jgi:hypothetical protein
MTILIKETDMYRRSNVGIALIAISMFVCGCQSGDPAVPVAKVQTSGIPAFPGAEGFGALASGGRACKVYEVTTLDDYGPQDKPIPGSFRDALSEPNRTVVFRVGGTITLKQALAIRKPNITVAGQTAPGDGICVTGYPIILRGTENIIIRYVRSRLGDTNNVKSHALDINKCKNVIVDHCSLTWGVDETASMYGNKDLTLQWCIIGQGLESKNHSMGGLWGPWTSYHHNLLYHNKTRNPKFAYMATGDITDYRNNVIYDWGTASAYCTPTGSVNMVGNYYKAGPSTGEKVKFSILQASDKATKPSEKKLYIVGNFMFGSPDITSDNWKGVTMGGIKFEVPFATPAVKTQTAEEAYRDVLASAGATLPHRDKLDLLAVSDVEKGAGKIIKSQSEVGGLPELRSGTALQDSDHDGMPDEWEKKHGFDPREASDGAQDKDGDGYTNLEEYLNNTDPTKAIDYTKPANNVTSLAAAPAK